ncbi:MAG: hypothetical protein FWG10_09470 [Eubacteriaceae bacterium]|nr:hypothetical protein [Eubacteriaceae bacterium]
MAPKDIRSSGFNLKKPTGIIAAATIVIAAKFFSRPKRKMRNELEVRRLLRMRDYEIYKFIERPGSDAFAYLLILDKRRPSSLDDFPWIPRSFEDESSFGRENLVTSIVVHNDVLDKQTVLDIEFTAMCLSELWGDCNWTHYVEKMESKEEFDRIQYDWKLWIHAFDSILEKHQFSIDVSGITEESFKYLSQD